MSIQVLILICLIIGVLVVLGSIAGKNGRTNPDIRRVKRLLVAESPAGTRYITLGANAFCVRVDAKAGTITITHRRFWFLRGGRTIPIKAVKWIDFRYLGAVSFNKDEETYRVVLVLKRGNERVPLVEFSGNANAGVLIGAKSYNRLTGEFSGENAQLLQEQHQGALWFVRSLSELLQVGLSEPVS